MRGPIGVRSAARHSDHDVASFAWVKRFISADSRAVWLDAPMQGRFAGARGLFLNDEAFEGRPIKVRFLWSEIEADSARWEQAFSADGGDSWEVNWIMRFARRGR